MGREICRVKLGYLQCTHHGLSYNRDCAWHLKGQATFQSKQNPANSKPMTYSPPGQERKTWPRG